MQIISVGPDEIDFDGDRHSIVVYWYQDHMYDGEGQAVCIRPTGEVDCYSLGHCSCYGPVDEYPDNPDETYANVQEFLRPRESVHDYNSYPQILETISELQKHIENTLKTPQSSEGMGEAR